jgi:hypothetical protein
MLILGDYDHRCERGKQGQIKSIILGRRIEHVGFGSFASFLDALARCPLCP